MSESCPVAIFQTKNLMGEVMKEASFSLAEAKFTTGDFSHLVLQNVNKALIKVRSKNDNVAGESTFWLGWDIFKKYDRPLEAPFPQRNSY